MTAPLDLVDRKAVLEIADGMPGWMQPRDVAKAIRTLPSYPAPAGDAWLPIETAPKDGSHFLGFDSAVDYGSPIFVCFYDLESECFCLDIYSKYQMTPTFWQPLPASPTAPGAK